MKDKEKDESGNPEEKAKTEKEDPPTDPGTTDAAPELAGDVTTTDVP